MAATLARVSFPAALRLGALAGRPRHSAAGAPLRLAAKETPGGSLISVRYTVNSAGGGALQAEEEVAVVPRSVTVRVAWPPLPRRQN